GNAAELIIALVALWQARAGGAKLEEMHTLVHASLTGSMIGNILLVLGASILAGGLFYQRQEFNRTAAGMGTTLLALATIGLLIPSLYHHFGTRDAGAEAVVILSEEISVVLFVVYLLSLVFSLKTHQHLFAGP